MSKIQERIKNIQKNDYFDLSNLDLVEIPNLPDELYAIKYLFLNDNKFEKINLLLFTNLVVLDISDNPLIALLNLPNALEELVCNNCKLEYIVPLPNLKILNCANNNLTLLDEYPKLYILDCSNNKIQIIDVYDNLVKLACSNNPMVNIALHPKLTCLDCRQTNITSVDNLSNLEILEVSYTKINKIKYMYTLKNLITDNINIDIDEQYKIESCIQNKNEYDVIFFTK